MNKELNGINKFLEGKTFGYDHRVSFSEKPQKGYYQFHIDKVAQLISIGEMKDHLFVSVKLVNGEGMVNYYLCAFGCWFCLFNGNSRLVQPSRVELADFQFLGECILLGMFRRSVAQVWCA